MSRRKEDFVPREAGKVSMYVCGPTVYNYIHIGNARTFLSFDVVRRYLTWRGFDVTFIQNITDVDDKIIKRANEEGRAPAEVASEYTDAFVSEMRQLGVEDPTIRPRATETIPEMITLIERLIAGDHAYVVPAGSDSVGKIGRAHV
jgi:cysteinyl-tRNA synthetase